MEYNTNALPKSLSQKYLDLKREYEFNSLPENLFKLEVFEWRAFWDYDGWRTGLPAPPTVVAKIEELKAAIPLAKKQDEKNELQFQGYLKGLKAAGNYSVNINQARNRFFFDEYKKDNLEKRAEDTLLDFVRNFGQLEWHKLPGLKTEHIGQEIEYDEQHEAAEQKRRVDEYRLERQRQFASIRLQRDKSRKEKYAKADRLVRAITTPSNQQYPTLIRQWTIQAVHSLGQAQYDTRLKYWVNFFEVEEIKKAELADVEAQRLADLQTAEIARTTLAALEIQKVKGKLNALSSGAKKVFKALRQLERKAKQLSTDFDGWFEVHTTGLLTQSRVESPTSLTKYVGELETVGFISKQLRGNKPAKYRIQVQI